ncbi:MAG: phosphoenolpyruvate synthase, partial [Notoacmeibacter sp.]|nr:phosphoenolpyruvate synthase [Notoacmeibacter sp.]
MTTTNPVHVLPLAEVRRADVPRVGGKNASLGEMIGVLAARGIAVPAGFATTADAFRHFLSANGLNETVAEACRDYESGAVALAETGARIRAAILSGAWPDDLAAAILQAYDGLCAARGGTQVSVAVRSSATAEDLPDASFAGQQETYLNISGQEALLDACKRCYASLFTDRAISYRQAKGFDQLAVALSIGVQLMVRSDRGGSGVMFSIDTETGFDKVVVINAAWGLGENVVQGAVDPDEYVVFKPLLDRPSLVPVVEKKCGAKSIKMIYGKGTEPTRNVPTSKVERAAFVLDDRQILTLARWAVTIETHYGCPMDMEWAKAGDSGDILIVQARPETVQPRP